MPPADIRILPPQLVNRIAAGEVVERPASVVKELVENAIDAGATRISIEAGAGGRNIRVADNGSGMSAPNARLAFYNHATSKLADETALTRISTLGFRGEALASIAAIARVSCQTRTTQADRGVKVVIGPDGEPAVSDTGCAAGTALTIQDLFYNTPARLKFLKRPQTELGHIEETVQNLALSHPAIQFSLSLNDKETLRTRGNGDLGTTIDDVFGLRAENIALIPVTWEDAELGLSIHGFISPPDVLKPSKRWMVTFVNNRVVRCPLYAKAVEAAYEALIPANRYPLCVLFFTLPLEEVDVNVHPTKREVRYAQANTVFGFIRAALRRSLESRGYQAFQAMLAPEAPTAGGGPNPLGSGFAMPRPVYPYGSEMSVRPYFNPPSGLPGQVSAQALDFYRPGEADQGQLIDPTPSQAEFRVIGQLFNTYVLLESRQGLMVIDQHIASERALFEALTRSTMDQAALTQTQIVASPIALTAEQHALLQAHHETFARLGFHYTLADTADGVTLDGVPVILEKRAPQAQFETLIQQLGETGRVSLDVTDMIATLACHSAVRAGDSLTHGQMEDLIRQWLACSLPWTCPHGRPIAHTIRTEELNRFFERPSLPVNAF